MKTLTLTLLPLLTALASAQVTFEVPSLVRFPVITLAHREIITNAFALSESQTYPNHFVNREGRWSNSYSSAQRSYDYLVVPGTVLQLSPPSTTLGGIVGSSILLRDLKDGSSYTVELESVGELPEGWGQRDENDMLTAHLRKGKLEVGGVTIFVELRYRSTPRYPAIRLTWGSGAGIGTVGTETDDYSRSIVRGEPLPLPRPELGKLLRAPDAGEFEVYLLGVAGEKNAYDVQFTQDFKTWRSADFFFVIVDKKEDPGFQIILILVPKGTGHAFFRARVPHF